MVSRLTRTYSEYESEKVSLLRDPDEDEDNDDETSGQQRDGKHRADPYIIVQLNPDVDKLSTLSLKYNVPVAEIKRINKIFKENELFALSKVKIPVKPQSFLTESHPEVHGLSTDGGWMSPTEGTLISLASSEVSSHVWSEESELGDPQQLGNDSQATTPSHTPKSKQTKRVKKFLKAKDKDLELIRQKNEVLVERSGSVGSSSFGSGGLRSTSVGALNYPAQSSGRPKAALAVVILFLCIATAVIVILWFSYYENQQIEHEHPKKTT